MGLFGNSDVKKLDRELSGLRAALMLGSRASTSAARFNAGVESAHSDCLRYAQAIKQGGHAPQGLAIVSKSRNNNLQGEARTLFEGLLAKVEAELS